MPEENKEEKSELLKPPEGTNVEQPKYTEEERTYLGRLMARFEASIIEREGPFPELDNMTYTEYWDANERLANTFIEPKKNKSDSNFQSGTARDKMLALLAALNNLNLSPDISAFDENNIEVSGMGEGMEDIMLKTREMEGDDEKKLLRQYELLKHGFVFCEEVWDERWMNEKKIQGGGKFTGQIEGFNWTTRLKRMVSQPVTNTLSNLAVFLGNYKQYFFEKQPYVFTLEITDYANAKSQFEKWDRWQYVPRTFTPASFSRKGNVLFDAAWKTLNVEAGQVVIIRYQDKFENEAALWISGVLMTPIGLPLSVVNGYNDYSITQQNFEPIHGRFALGNSLMRKLRGKVGALDEMIRLAVLKNQKSYKPPKFNFSGRVLSSNIFDPGKMTAGIPRDSIVDADLHQNSGVTQPEFAMIQEMKTQINDSSVSPTFQGQSSGGDTATEIVEMQRQAKLMLGLSIFACSLLEWKLSWLRLYNILAKWFEPEDQVVDETRKMLIDKYRVVNQERPIRGEGMGRRIVMPVKMSEGQSMPSAQEVMDAEESLKTRTGRPTRIVLMDVSQVKSSKKTWRISIKPREKETSELSKLMFRAELADARVFGPMLNMDFMAEKFAHKWGEDPTKMFNKNPAPQVTPVQAKGVQAPGVPTPQSILGPAVETLKQ